MDRFNALGRGAQVMLIAGVLLIIDSFFDWQAVDDFPGVSAWDNFLGILMGLLTIALVAWIGARLAGVEMRLPVSNAMLSALFGWLILLFAVLKNLTDDYSTFWAYLGVLFAAAIAFGAWLEVQEGGGFEQLKSEIPSSDSTAETASAPPPPPASSAPPEAAPPPAEPAPPAAPEPPPPAAPEPAPPETPPPAEPDRPPDPDEPRSA